MPGEYRTFPLPFGLSLTVVVRSRPLGCGLTLWTARQRDEATIVRGNVREHVKKAA